MKTKLEKNQAIMASAGCGKTEELAMRYIKLLAAGAPPESILALTFTRLAAGEMLDRVFERLSEAVLFDKSRTNLMNQLWGEEKPEVDFAKLLKLLIEKLNCLRLATLDSFFVELVKCFAPELDVDLNLQLTDDFSDSVLETKAIDKIYSSAREDKEYYKELKKTFDRMTQDNEESSVEKKFQKGIKDGHELFLKTKKAAWGNFKVPDIDTSDENWAELVENFENCEGFQSIKTGANPIKYLEKLKKYDEEEIIGKGPIKNLLKNKKNKKNKNGEIAYYKWNLIEQDNDKLQEIIDFIFARRIVEIIAATKAYCTFLDSFNKEYCEIKSNSGLITFSDICRILNNNQSLFMDAGKMEMYFRLDATIKHLLIDEFQDTSWEQWQAIFPIAEEIISDTSGDRSFFIVGDIKQAIYSWRGGDSELFGKIIDYYQNIKNDSLEKSWRSGNNILNPINDIFSSENEKIKIWKEKSKFKNHSSAVNEKKPGYTEVRSVEVENPAGKNATVSEQTAAKQEAVISLLKEIKPWDRGLKTALLFSTNENLNDWSIELKKAGIPCLNQGKSRLLDNVAVQAVLALFKWMELPEDKLAEFHVQNSFLCEGVKTRENLYDLKSFLFYNSYAELIEKVIAKIRKTASENTNARLDQLIETAEQFQKNASTCPADFIKYVEKIHKKEPPTSEGVVLVTMHSSKGMTYDIVILPDMDLALPNSGKLTFLKEVKEFDGELKPPEIEAVLFRPSGDIAKTNPLINSMLSSGIEKLEHEFYNKMYVALTRAAKSLYIVCSEKKESFSELIKNALEGKGDKITPASNLEDIPGEIFFQKGNPLWFENEKIKINQTKPIAKKVKSLKLAKNSKRRRQQITPSSVTHKDEKKYKAPVYFRKKSRGAERGTIIHELFSTIEWIENSNFESKEEVLKVAQKVSKTFSEKEVLETVDDFLMILKKDEIKMVLEKPPSICEVFKEKSFADIIEKKVVRGTFDRVVLFPDSINPEKIDLYDYKTDAVETEQEISDSAEKYAPQLQLYADALSQAYSIPKDKISKFLIFTSPGIVKKC